MNRSCEQFEELVSRSLDGPLPDAEREELRAHLETCGSCREFAADLRAMVADLESAGAVEASRLTGEMLGDRVLAGIRTPSKRRRLWGVGAAIVGLAAAVILVVTLYQRSRRDSASIPHVDTVARITGLDVARVGNTWRTPAVDSAGTISTMYLDDGSRLELEGGTVLRFEEAGEGFRNRMELLRGRMVAHVSKAEGRFVVETGSGSVEALGTAFSVGVRTQDSAAPNGAGGAGMNTSRPVHVIMSLAVLTGTVLVNTSWGQETLGQGEKREITAWAVQGRIVDPAGKPIAGARVWAGNNQPYQTAVMSRPSTIVWRMIGRSDVEVEPSDLGPFAKGPVVTDAEGRFLVKNISSPMDGFVSVVHPDFLALRRKVVRENGNQVEDGLLDVKTLTLTRGIEIAGKVQDRQGRPIAEANVAIVRPSGGWSGNPEPIKWAQTDAQGRFVMRGISPKAKGLMLGAWTTTRPADSIRLEGGQSRKDLVLTLEKADPAHRIRARVTNAEDGSPMVDCMVQLQLVGDPGAFNRKTYDRRRTDKRGRVEFGCVPDGEYVLQATPADQVPLIGRYNPPPWSVARACEPGSDLELALLPAIPFAGVVRDASTETPVTRFSVNAHFDFRAYTREYRARYGHPDPQRLGDGPHLGGLFSLPSMRTGEWTIRILSDGYMPLVKVVRMELGRHKEREVFELQRAKGQVTGLVLDAESGEPIQGALVNAYEWSPRYYGANRRYCNSDAKGHFRSTRLILDDSLVQKFWVSKDGYLRQELVFERGAVPPGDLGKIRLVRECVLTGVLQDAKGQPLDRVSVELRSSTGRGKGGRSTLTGLDGSYRFAGLAVGHYYLWVRNQKIAEYDFEEPGTVRREKPRELDKSDR